MVRSIRALLLVALAFAVAAPASAAVYTLHLKNGTTFETRYEPEDAPWDAQKLVFVNEWGNLMSLAKAEVDRVDTDVEVAGFGHQLDSTTVALGWAPNDAPAPGSQGAVERATAQADEAAAALAPTTAVEPIYDVNQSPPTLPIYPVFSGTPEEASVIVVPPPGSAPEAIEPPR
ncbi:MAG TPA: hypothetical protein VI942_04900 [Thermoanaerobaculia bacterium]|nr:hypothetical protein [Thermoanaerobaculia bacterium]